MKEIDQLKKRNRELQLQITELELQVEKLTRMKNQLIFIALFAALIIFISANT